MQPISGYQYRRLNAAGTVVLSARPTVLRGVLFSSGTQAGTVILHDNASGTAGTATYLSLFTARTGTGPIEVKPNIQTQNGLVADVTGANDFTVTWS
jgi:hypothetical protein